MAATPLTLDRIAVSVADGPDTLRILDGVSLDVAAGEVVALSGASGPGKSTVLAVAGLLREPTSGSVVVAGHDVGGLDREQRTRLRGDEIGFVFQSSNLFASLTAMEQLEFAAHINGNLNSRTTRRARELLVAVGLEGRRDARPAQLSGGERQRVGIARALVNEPAILLADEPTAALDDDRGRDIMSILVDETTRGDVAALVVTHNPAQLPPGTRQVALADGTVRAVPATRT